MDQEFIDALLAVRPRLTSGEFNVALARVVGHRTHFDIKRITGLKVDAIKRAEEGIVAKCDKLILRIIGLTNKTIRSSSSQNATVPLSHQVMMYLLKQLGRQQFPISRDYKAFNEAYAIAYKFSGRDNTEAILLLKDCIDLCLEDFRKARYPGPYLPRVLDTYLSQWPKKTKSVRENEEQIGKKLRWNPEKRQYEVRPK